MRIAIQCKLCDQSQDCTYAINIHPWTYKLMCHDDKHNQSIKQYAWKKHKTIHHWWQIKKQKHNIQSITQVRQWHRRHKTTNNHSIVNTSTSMSISELLNEYTLNIELCNCLRAIPQLSIMSNTYIFGDRGTWYTHADAIPKYTPPHCPNVQNSP